MKNSFPIETRRSWFTIWAASVALAFALITVNEILLAKASHQPSIVSDADLWATQRERLDNPDSSGIILLGASRMQTNIDIATMEKFFGEPVIQLAQSGLGTSLPVLRDIADNTNFAGLVLISETESTLLSSDDQQQSAVDHYHKRWTYDRKLNRHLGSMWQSNFRFCNPTSSSYRLWGNILVERELPKPNHTKTLASRQQLSDFENPEFVERVNRLRGQASSPPDADKVFKADLSGYAVKVVARWSNAIRKLQDRGGRVVFVRMPVSEARAKVEEKQWPLDEAWQPAMLSLGVIGIHHRQFQELAAFNFPDTSHLDYRDAKEFIERVCKRLADF